MTNENRKPSDAVGSLYGPSTVLIAQLTIATDDDPESGANAARTWFGEAFKRASGPLRERLTRQEPLDVEGTEALQFVPSQVRGVVEIAREKLYDSPYRSYNAASWATLMDTLGDIPLLAALNLDPVDEAGEATPDFVYITSSRHDIAGRTWINLAIQGRGHLTETGADGDLALAAVLRETADSSNPVYGEISWRQDSDITVLESCLGLRPETTLPTARSVARGYAWVTILPEALGVRLGGEARLTASDAFVEVTHLTAGGFLLRATERLKDYDRLAAEKVFSVLAPVLPSGRPSFYRLQPPNALADADPAVS